VVRVRRVEERLVVRVEGDAEVIFERRRHPTPERKPVRAIEHRLLARRTPGERRAPVHFDDHEEALRAELPDERLDRGAIRGAREARVETADAVPAVLVHAEANGVHFPRSDRRDERVVRGSVEDAAPLDAHVLCTRVVHAEQAHVVATLVDEASARDVERVPFGVRLGFLRARRLGWRAARGQEKERSQAGVSKHPVV